MTHMRELTFNRHNNLTTHLIYIPKQVSSLHKRSIQYASKHPAQTIRRVCCIPFLISMIKNDCAIHYYHTNHFEVTRAAHFRIPIVLFDKLSDIRSILLWYEIDWPGGDLHQLFLECHAIVAMMWIALVSSIVSHVNWWKFSRDFISPIIIM